MGPTLMAPADAARELRELARFDLALRQRMEGILWIVLGLTLAALFFSYAFAILDDAPLPFLALLWVPWSVAGAVAVHALRRSLVLAGSPEAPSRAGWLFAGLAASVAVALLALVNGGREVAPVFALLAIGVLAFAPALAPGLGYTRLGRRVGVALGSLGVLAALAVLVAGGDGSWGTWAAGAVCFSWVLGGAYQVLQG